MKISFRKVLIGVFFSFETVFDRLEDDLEIQEGAPVGDVPEVAVDSAFELVVGGDAAPEAGDLCIAGDAGLNAVTVHVVGHLIGIFLGVPEHVGTGANDGHVAYQDVPELGNLIEVALAKELSKPGDALVFPDCLTEVGTGVETHGAELVTDELSSIATGASLTEEDRSSGGNLDKTSNDQKGEWEDEKDDKQGEGKVKGSLCHPANRIVDGVLLLRCYNRGVELFHRLEILNNKRGVAPFIV